MNEMPSRIIDVLSCNDQQRWEFLSCTTILKPKHYYLNGKCVYCELEAMKEREAKLKAQLYDAEETFASVLEDMEHYKENECIPTDDEINQVRNTLKSLILSRIEGAGND